MQVDAALDYARSEAVIIIDADPQGPPELIPKLVKEWKNGDGVGIFERTRS